jgi:hypothetical protein
LKTVGRHAWAVLKLARSCPRRDVGQDAANERKDRFYGDLDPLIPLPTAQGRVSAAAVLKVPVRSSA